MEFGFYRAATPYDACDRPTRWRPTGLHACVHGAVTLSAPIPLDERCDAALQLVLAAIAEGHSLVALTGPEGAGKTRVLDRVAAELEQAGVRVVRVDGMPMPGTRLALRDLLAQISPAPAAEGPPPGIDELLDMLTGIAPPGGDGPGGSVVTVDNAQNLQADAVEFFRLAAVLGHGQPYRGRVVFAGRPDFWDIFHDDGPGKRGRLVRARIALDGLEEIPAVAAPPPPWLPPVVPAMLQPVRRGGGGVARRVVLAGALVMGTAGIPVTWQFPSGWDRPREAASVALPLAATATEPAAPDVPPALAALDMAGTPVDRAGLPPEEVPELAVAAPEAAVAEVTVEPPAPVAAAPDIQDGAAQVEMVPVDQSDWPGLVDLPPPAVLEPGAIEVVVAAPANPRPVPSTAEPGMTEMLVKRGDQLLAVGDISGARLSYGRAAAGGSAAAATAMARTYDPEALMAMGGRGIVGDAATAARWYRRAQELER